MMPNTASLVSTNRKFVMKSLLITTTVAAAMLTAGCNQVPTDDSFVADQDVSVCTDANGARVDDDYCANPAQYASSGVVYHPVFVSSGTRVPAYGTRVVGGSLVARPGASYARASAVSVSRSASISRGGFGSSAGRGGFSVGG